MTPAEQAEVVEAVGRLLDHVPGSLDAFAALLDPSMSAKRPCRT